MHPGRAPGFDAVVLAGGTGRRIDGRDKAIIEIAGTTLLERALAAVAGARRTIVVGPQRETARPVTWIREEPAGGGPAAGLAAGVAHVSEDLVVVLAVDHPFVTDETVSTLISAAGEHDGAMLSAGGRAQPLVGVYRAGPLRTAIRASATTVGMAVRELIEGLDVITVEDPEGGRDVDTWSDVEMARRRMEGST